MRWADFERKGQSSRDPYVGCRTWSPFEKIEKLHPYYRASLAALQLRLATFQSRIAVDGSGVCSVTCKASTPLLTCKSPMLLHQVAGFLLRADRLSRLLPRLTLRSLLKLPDIGINLILELITQTDHPQFRLVSKAWCNLIPAYALKQRVIMYHHPGWEQMALQVRQRLPNASVVVRTSSITGLAGLLRNPSCNVVSCFPQSFGAFEQWQLQPLFQQPDMISDKQATVLAQLRGRRHL